MENNLLLVLLLLIEVGLLIASYHNNKHDPASPCVGTFFLFSISMMFSIVGNISWNKHFEFSTFITVLLSSLIIFLIDIAVRKKQKRSLHKRITKNNIKGEINRIDISQIKILLLTGITLMLTVYYVASIHKYGKDNVNFLAKQGIKIVMATGFVNTFILINNILSNSKKKKDFLLAIPFVCGCICSFYTGVRTEILRLILAAFIFFTVLFQEKKGWKYNNIALKQIVQRFGMPVIIFLVAFFLMRNAIKTSGLGENMNYGFFMYMAFYIGSPWIVLNQKICLGLDLYKSTTWGRLTFGNLLEDLQDLRPYSLSLEKTKTFTSLDAALQINANADTIIGSPLIDFGLVGALLLIAVTYYIISKYYYNKIKYTTSSTNRNLSLIIYAFIYYIVGISFYACGVTFIVSVYYITTMVLIWGIWQFYFRIKI